MRFLANLVLIFCLIIPLFTSCDSGPEHPNILLICVDTLRSDRLGYNGYERFTSPNIDAFAASSLVFSNAFSQSGWTLPSMATIMTGQHPKDHHAVDFHFGINRELPTLASILKNNGYDTRAYVSHLLLTAQYGFDKGFYRFDSSVLDHGDPHEISTSMELNEIAIQDMADLREPYFIWIHYFDPHFAYLPHKQWESFGNSSSDRYDQEIAYTDFYIGQLLEWLDTGNLLDNTAIIFTSDHGEEFGEHGGIYHYTCYNEVLRVPLYIKAPSVTVGTNFTLVDQIDLLPTMLALANVQTREEFPGRNLIANPLAPRPIFVERDRPPGYRQRAVILDDRKLLRIEPADTTLIPEESLFTASEVKNVVPGVYLFDITKDPAELTNLFPAETAAAERLLARMASHFTGHHIPAEEIGVDEDLRAKLRSLGYIH